MSASGFAAGLSSLAKDSDDKESHLREFKRGGRVKKTGPAKVHKGERVLTKEQAKKYSKRKRSKGK